MGVPPSGSGCQPSASAAVPASSRSGIPNAVRRTLSPFEGHPRDGTPFHIATIVRFNPVLERHETLVWSEDGERREWVGVQYKSTPTYWFRQVPLPYSLPDDGWFPASFALQYLVRRKTWRDRVADFLARMASRLSGAPAMPTTTWTWCSAAQAIEARRAATGTGAVADESAVGNADAPGDTR